MFICTGIICVFSFLSACSAGPTPQVLINCLIAFRFLNGIGIGGEYRESWGRVGRERRHVGGPVPLGPATDAQV